MKSEIKKIENEIDMTDEEKGREGRGEGRGRRNRRQNERGGRGGGQKKVKREGCKGEKDQEEDELKAS